MTSFKHVLLAAVLLVISGCGGPPDTRDPAALMSYAWAQPAHEYPAHDWEPRVDGLCRHKVRWVMERCRCGEMLLVTRVMDRRRVDHAALLVGDTVYDFDGARSYSEYTAYPTTVIGTDWRAEAAGYARMRRD